MPDKGLIIMQVLFCYSAAIPIGHITDFAHLPVSKKKRKKASKEQTKIDVNVPRAGVAVGLVLSSDGHMSWLRSRLGLRSTPGGWPTNTL